ncbi:molybdate ABC transporter substrate-binding protein [Roseibium sp. CAU 1637]|uniref:Molybdate ABC transporter substrate-binding protein n=1 Tax=Roseibium limicola TaxID=2816037 RepID=A0A939JAA9_9HYPH|nr:molybdate ABC transporter substrate-binding protein [Roseibium limicola]MBO0347241.1 molybdate ABC transporter substrate-binding protein [Roseibium limicola]
MSVSRKVLMAILGLVASNWLLPMSGPGSRAMAADEKPLTVFAAASMTDALTEIGQAYERDGHGKIVFSFAGTGTLARQLEAGAPADVFVSADVAWMDYVVERGAVDAGSVVTIAGNALVVIGAEGEEPLPQPLTLAALTSRLDGGRLAIADPETVPAGRYARQSFESLGLWGGVSDALAPMENVRVALASVARGETPLGVVYGSDAVVEPRVKIVARLPQGSHTAISYPAALVPNAPDQARDFLGYLGGPKAVKILEDKGFLALNETLAN